MLPGIGGIGGFFGESEFTVEYLSVAEIEDTSQTTFTYSSQGIGAAAATREIYVLISWGAAGAATVTSATIGGVSATIRTQDTFNGPPGVGVAIISAAVPSGTTGTIAVTFNTNVLSCAIGIVRVVGKTTNVDAASDAGPDGSAPYTDSVNVNVNVNGAVLACWVCYDTGQNVTWTNVTEKYEGDTAGAGGASINYSGAVSTGLSASTPLAVSASQGGSGNNGVGIAAVSIA